MHLNPLYRKLVGKIVFRVETPLSVGVGGEEMFRQVLRVGDRVVIPATTWKGAFRSIAERLAKSMELQGVEGLAVKLYRETEKGIIYRPTDHDSEWERFLSEFKNILSNQEVQTPGYGLDHEEVTRFLNDMYVAQDQEDIKDKAERYLAYNCPIGRLFGNHVLAGKVRFIDTVLEIKQTHLRPGIGMDRPAGKVKEGLLYYIESIPSGTEITLRFVADNLLPRKTDTKLFDNTLEYIRVLGIQIGARKSAGMGLLKVIDIQKQEIDLKSDTVWMIVRPFQQK